MGCWNGTCMISNLPIESGEEVKLVLMHIPYGKGEIKKPSFCYPNGIYHPGTFALNGKYNDYGGVEDIETDLNFNLIEGYFTSKYKKIKVEGNELEKFTLYDILEGIERGTLKVLTEGDIERKKMAQEAVKVYSEHGYSSEECKKEWEDLANMDVSEKWRKGGINFVMIRKDVWDNIIKEHKTEFFNDEPTNRNNVYLTAQEWVRKRFDKYKKTSLKSFANPISMGGYAGGNIMFMQNFYHTALVSCDEEQLDFIMTLMTELVIIDSFLGSTRKGWMPVSGAGSQSSEWNSYLLLNKIVDNVCNQKIKEYEEYEKEYD